VARLKREGGAALGELPAQRGAGVDERELAEALALLAQA
jgi:hypothetical protein